MRTDPSSVTTSNSVPAEFAYRGGEFGELVIIYNPATNTNRIWAALNRDATTAGVTGQTCISPGQYAFFILTQEDNRSGINVIAETGTTVVTVQRQSFRSRLELVAVMGGLYGGAVAGQYWVAVSGTAVKLAGAYTEAQMDTARAKTTNGEFRVSKNGSGGAVFGSTSNLQNPSNTMVGNGSTNTEYHAAVIESLISGTIKEALSSTERALISATAWALYNGAGTDERHRMNVTDRIRGVTGNGLVNAVFDSEKLPIQNGAVIAVGDLVEWDNAGANAVVTATAASDRVLGICVAGGTGNAGQSVFATIRYCGLIAALVADVAGVVAGAWLRAGATTPATKCSTVGANEGTFGRAWATAASGATFPARLFGGL